MYPRPFTLRDAISGIRKRKFLIAAIFATILLLVGAATLLATKKYGSESKVFVRLGRENIGLDPTMTLGEKQVVTAPMSREAEINSIAAMIRSRNLYEKVVDEIGVDRILKGDLPEDEGAQNDDNGPSMWNRVATVLTDMGVLNDISDRERAIIKITKKLSVKILERSNVVLVDFEAESPKLAQDVVSSLVNEYLDRHVKMHRGTGTQKLLEKQVEKSANKLAEKESALEKFRSSTGILSASLEKQQLIERMSIVKNQLIDANVLSASLDSEVAKLKTNFEKLAPTQIVSKMTGSGNEGVDGMRQELYRQEIELERMLAQHTPRHPKVVAARNAIREAKRILSKDELIRTESVYGMNPVYDEIQIVLLKKEPALFAAQAKADALSDELHQVQETLAEFSKHERRYDELIREQEIEEDKYRRYLRSIAQADVDSSLEENKLSNLSVSQTATYSEKPVRPNKLINLILGIALAFFGSLGAAIFLEYMDLSSDDELIDVSSNGSAQLEPSSRFAQREPSES